MNDIIVYHGSRGGIIGSISPVCPPEIRISHKNNSDFGSGFYTGTNPNQAKSLVVENENPYFYKLRFRLSEIPEDDILILNGKEWLYTVLACRNRVREFSELSLAKQIRERINDYDVVIGTIADDRMNFALNLFSQDALTDEALFACLSSIDYGQQIVAKTDYACSKIEILEEKKIQGKDAEYARLYGNEKRDEGRSVVRDIQRKYRNKGNFLTDIVEYYRNEDRKHDDIRNSSKTDGELWNMPNPGKHL